MRLEWDIPPGQTPSDVQHNLMATHYRNIIKTGIQEFDPSQEEAVYNALSWSGLLGTGQYDSTIAWSNLSPSERLNIISTGTTFANTNPDCQ